MRTTRHLTYSPHFADLSDLGRYIDTHDCDTHDCNMHDCDTHGQVPALRPMPRPACPMSGDAPTRPKAPATSEAPATIEQASVNALRGWGFVLVMGLGVLMWAIPALIVWMVRG